METGYLCNDDPELWEKVKGHEIEFDEDDNPMPCKKCGKEAVMQSNMNWICPVSFDIPLKYFHTP